jgi:hypothetical protein
MNELYGHHEHSDKKTVADKLWTAKPKGAEE